MAARPGQMVYLSSCQIQVDVEAVQTPPDTPNMYGAQLKVMGDQGDMNLDAVTGDDGPDGRMLFCVREAVKLGWDPVDDPANLPELDDLPEHVGLYWQIDEMDDLGHYVTTWTYIWMGAYYRQIMMGTVGDPGAIPAIQIHTQLVAENVAPSVKTAGGTLNQTWTFMCPSPAGPPGQVGPLFGFPDVDEVTNPPQINDLLGFNGRYTPAGAEIFEPINIEHYLPQPYSMPSGDFTPYSGISQQAPIGQYTLPAQPFPYTPLIWGHLAAGGLSVSSNPLMIGAQVLIDNATTGRQIARGRGTSLGMIEISPHYSTAEDPNANITPTNSKFVIPANTECTIYVNLWNDGQLGYYNFNPTPQPTSLQGSMNTLTSNMGAGTGTNTATGLINNVISLLGGWTTGVPGPLQALMNGVMGMIGTTVPVGGDLNAQPTDVTQALTDFLPKVTNLASSLGSNASTTPLSGIVSLLTSWTAPVTTAIQTALDDIAGVFGLAGTGHTTDTVASQLTSVTPALTQLENMLGGNWIPTVVSVVNGFTGTITSPIQSALDSVANMVGLGGTGNTPTAVTGQLNSFQSALDSVANTFGLGGTGNTVLGVMSTAVPFLSAGTLSTAQANPITSLFNVLGQGGLAPTILNLLGALTPLLGSLLTGYTTEAQLFILAQPILAGVLI